MSTRYRRRRWLCGRRSPSDADSSSKEKSEASSEAAAFVLMSEDIAEESENEPEAAEDDDEAQLSRRRRGRTGESEAALANPFIVIVLSVYLIVKNYEQCNQSQRTNAKIQCRDGICWRHPFGIYLSLESRRAGEQA